MDTDDESANRQPEVQEENIVQISQITSNASKMDEPKSNLEKFNQFGTKIDQSTQQIRSPTNLIDPLASNAQINPSADNIQTIPPSNQAPIATDMEVNQNSNQHSDDISVNQDSLSDLSTPDENSDVDLNGFDGNGTDILISFLIDHQYAKPQSTADQMDESQTKSNPEISTDDHNGQNSRLVNGVDVIEDDEPTDIVQPTDEKENSQFQLYPELIDLTSDYEDVASTITDNGQTDDDDEVRPQIQPKSVYNTRNAKNSTAGRWKTLTNDSAMVCTNLNCGLCNDYSNKIEKPYKCPTCARGFVRKSYLLRHIKIHENQFRCSICHVALPDANSCKSHQNYCKHTRFECYLCQKYFCDTSKMSKHMCNIHIGKRIRRLTRRPKFRIVLREYQI